MRRTIAAVLMVTTFATTAGFALEAGSVAREKAIRECTAISNKFKQRTWGAWELHKYRGCMASLNQKE